jgi:hypothetical protein
MKIMRLASPTLARAAFEYRWLIDRGYAMSAALKLVGDRHQMTRDERMILFRGVSTSRDSKTRSAIVIAPDSLVAGLEIHVDGYNQALTIMHYLAGRPLFVGTDGLTRDAGSAHGRIMNHELFERAVGLLADRLATPKPGNVAVYLDAPVSGSGGHAALFRQLFAARGMEALVLLEKSADAPLKAIGLRAGAPRGNGLGTLVATSDSAIVEALSTSKTHVGSGARIYDSARWAIELAFGHADFLDLGCLIGTEREALSEIFHL